MSNKPKRATDELSIELSKISTTFSIMGPLLAELPDSMQKKALARLCEEGKKAEERAFDHLQTITRLASAI